MKETKEGNVTARENERKRKNEIRTKGETKKNNNNKGRKACTAKKRGMERLLSLGNRWQRVGCLATEPRAWVAFTLSDINGFQLIRAKWNG